MGQNQDVDLTEHDDQPICHGCQQKPAYWVSNKSEERIPRIVPEIFKGKRNP
jgi:hypothetical protein